MNILDRIVEHKRVEVNALKKDGISSPGIETGPRRGFIKRLLKGRPVGLIAEAKKASPSRGLICPEFEPARLAMEYEEGGADGMSVLTDKIFFQGALSYLLDARQACGLPVLRKDFIIDHLQVDEAVLWGADAILLICAVLDRSLLEELILHARELGMDCLVEVHDEYEAEEAMEAGAELIGINNRNLKDFSVSLDTSLRVRKVIPTDIPVVSESGIKGFDDIERLQSGNIQAVLVGESLVRSGDRPAKIRELKGH